jgi:hypothetical protein
VLRVTKRTKIAIGVGAAAVIAVLIYRHRKRRTIDSDDGVRVGVEVCDTLGICAEGEAPPGTKEPGLLLTIGNGIESVFGKLGDLVSGSRRCECCNNPFGEGCFDVLQSQGLDCKGCS